MMKNQKAGFSLILSLIMNHYDIVEKKNDGLRVRMHEFSIQLFQKLFV